MPNFSIIYACDQTRGIGKANDLPWRLPEDLAYFSEITTKTKDPERQNAVIMGRKTWESLPSFSRPLKSRLNIVISRDQTYQAEGGYVVASFDEALALAEQLKAETIFNIGGAQIFNLGFTHPGLVRIYQTVVVGDFACDAFLDPIPGHFQLKSQSPSQQSAKSISYRFEVYE